MIKTILKTIAASIFFLVLFFVITFPFQRFTPKARLFLERGLQNIGFQADCSIEGLDIEYPLGIQWRKLGCYQGAQTIFETAEGSLVTLPKRQHFETSIGKGSLVVKTNANLKSPMTEISASLTNVPIDRIAPLILAAISAHNPRLMIPKTLKLEGALVGNIDLPLQSIDKKSGRIDLQFLNFKIPQQSLSELYGLKDLAFTKGTIKADLKSGKLTIGDISVLSPEVSLKIEGSLDLKEEILKSAGPITIKWKIQKSDALMGSPMGSSLANFACPSQDSEGFCSKKYQRLSEIFGTF